MKKELTQRSRELFDNGWKFRKGDFSIRNAVKAGQVGGITDCVQVKDEMAGIAYSDGEVQVSLDPEEWREVDLPHDWCVEGEYRDDSTTEFNHGFLSVGAGCYRKVFEIPSSDQGRRISIEFDGVFRNSTVWVNGHLLGTHSSGYTPFAFDLTEVLRYGDEGRNVIFVKVDAREYEGWWYEGCGIYRHVWLVKTDAMHVARWGTYVTTPQVTDTEATVVIRTTIFNEYDARKKCRVESAVCGQDGSVIATASSAMLIAMNTEAEFEQNIAIPTPKVWSPETPNLYKVMTRVMAGSVVVDTYETVFGVRTIEFTSDRGFLLNGRPTLIKGTCNHQDFAGVGVALPDRLHEYKIERLKEMGSNAYRCSHNPPAPELLEACDRLGMLVMDENRKLDCSSDGLSELRTLILRDRNHPSIILWSMENEEPLEGTTMGARIVGRLVKETHKLDSTRPCTAAMNHGRNEGGYSDRLDVVGYNYGNYENRGWDVSDHTSYPKRTIIGSETTSSITTRGIYEDDANRGYCHSYAKAVPWGCSPEKAWLDVVQNPFLTGVFVWTGFDYRGEPTPYKWPCINSHFGIMDTCGFPKDSYYYYRASWGTDPVLHIFPHWNWPGSEGKEIEVWGYSNCETIELFCNGRSLGSKQMVADSHVLWKVAYEPGELVARGSHQSKSVVTKVVTTGAAAALRLAADHRHIMADGRDVSVVRVAVVDANGVVVPVADNEIEFVIAGPGKLLGVGNGNPSSHEPDKASKRRAFNGWCLALIQSTGKAGEIVLEARSNGLKTSTVEIAVK